ncbi:MAG: hypothetical protein ABMA64_13720 [Myxococcota bacterium]
MHRDDPQAELLRRWFRDLPLEHPVVAALFDIALQKARARSTGPAPMRQK